MINEMNGPVTLYHHRRIRIERAKGFMHAVPAVVLLSGIAGAVGGDQPFTWLLGIELLVGAAYLVLLVRELRALRRHGAEHHAPVAWLELAAAGILGLEGYHIWHRHHTHALLTGEHRLHVLPWVYATLAVWYALMAFGLAHLQRRRFLDLQPDGFAGRLQLLGRRFHYARTDVARLEPVGATDVVVHRTRRRTAAPLLRRHLQRPRPPRPAGAAFFIDQLTLIIDQFMGRDGRVLACDQAAARIT